MIRPARDLKKDLMFIEWDGKKLRDMRRLLGLNRRDIAKTLDLSEPTITKIERGESLSPTVIQMYGIVLERYYAYQHDYVPAFRKIGTDKFVNNFFMEENK